jgi:hemerythrin-like metal-binding protein
LGAENSKRYAQVPAGTEIGSAMACARLSAREFQMIVWTERFSIGLKKIDRQHQRLFAIINDLIRNQTAAADSEVIADILARITEYTNYHFKTEERVMMEYGYPDYPLQVAEHTEFKAKTAKFCLDAMTGKSGLSAEMLDYLQSWLVNHILESDLKFKDFLMQNGFLPDCNAVTASSSPRAGAVSVRS